jgi:hypothetical protein
VAVEVAVAAEPGESGDEKKSGGGLGAWGSRATARELTLAAIPLSVSIAWYEVGLKNLRNLAWILAYADHTGRMSRRKRTKMDVAALTRTWVEVIVGLSTAHHQQEHNAADHQTDDLLGPILLAPIAQVREFAQTLGAALEADERVPFMVWASFRRVVEPVLLKGPDSAGITLRTEMAQEIAELVEGKIERGDLIAAIAGALQWRGLTALTEVKTAVEAGGRPRLRGRESCLFLAIQDADEKEVALVML